MTDLLDHSIFRLVPTDLATLDGFSELHTRKDRKYILDPRALASVLEELPVDARALEIGGRRWFTYETTYFDTADLVSYRLAAVARPTRFKVRVRRYVDTDVTVFEVKTKDRRGRTVKNRLTQEPGRRDGQGDLVRSYAARFEAVERYADALEPRLANRYRRATLAFPAEGTRATIDCAFECFGTDGRRVGLGEALIVETKSAGAPTRLDRLLWEAGHRPVKVSKYATGLAALHPELRSNRWHRVLVRHFASDREPAATRVDSVHHHLSQGMLR